jgi:membrane-associated phospholipid phosphatase
VLARILALLAAAGSGFGVWLTWRVFVSTSTGQVIEQAALTGATYGQTRLWRLAEPVLDSVSQPLIIAGIAVAVVISVLRRRWVLGVQAAVLVGGANLTTQLLKRGILDRPALGGDVGGASLPSGHTTVAASLAAALLIVAPRWARPWIAVVGAIYTAATGVSTLIGQWHRPSDAIAAVLVVVAWASLVCALGPASAADPAALPGTAALDRQVRARPSAPSGAADAGPPPGTAPQPVPRAEPGPGPQVRSVGTAPAAALLLLGAVLAGLPAGLGYAQAFRDARAGVEIGTVATYAAGALAVSAVCAAGLLVLLLVRQSTARPSIG